MEEEIAFLVESMRIQPSEVYSMPYSRRQRLIEWKDERLQEEKRQQEQSASNARSRSRR